MKLPYDPTTPLLAIYPEQSITEKRNMYPNVHCSTVYNIQGMEAPRNTSEDEWIKKLWYIYTVEYYSAIKRNALESVLMKQMNIEPIIQNQKEKNEYHILTYIQKMVVKNLCAGQQWKWRQTQRTDLWIQWEKERVETCTLLYVKQIASGHLLCDTRSSNPVHCD